jgi:hypothetical protein
MEMVDECANNLMKFSATAELVYLREIKIK